MRGPFVSLLVAALLGGPAPALARVLWRGDFETGNLSQWTRAQVTSPDRIQVVSSPVTQGRYAARVLVRQGDDPISSSGNRSELVYLSYEPEGSERFYRWQTMWDPSYPSAKAWQLFTQWHHSGSNGSPPVEFTIYGEQINLRVTASTVVWTAPLSRGKWHDFVFHVKWSSDPSVGFVELYYDGEIAVPKRNVATQFAGQTNYLKQGLYRNEIISEDGIVYHDGFTIGETLADVLDPGQPVPDAGTFAPDVGSARPDAASAPDARASADAGRPPRTPDASAADAAATDQGIPDAFDAPEPGDAEWSPPNDAATNLQPEDNPEDNPEDSVPDEVDSNNVGCLVAGAGSLAWPGILASLVLALRRRRER
jgi:hypothetical protein